MGEEQELLMLFETNATIETEKFNNSDKKQALLEERNRRTRLLSLNSKLYQTIKLKNQSIQKENIEHPEPTCDLNKSRYATSDLPNMRKTNKLRSNNCLTSNNNTNMEKSSVSKNEKNIMSVNPKGNKPQNYIISNGSELKTDTQSSIISETRSSSRTPKNSYDRGSQTAELDDSIQYWNCENCSNKNTRNSSNIALPVLKGGGFGFMGAKMDYQISDKPKIEVDICPPLEIIQPTFNDFYEVDADWLEQSALCPYEDISFIDDSTQAPEEPEDESESSIVIDPCENQELMTDWERCLAGCCEEACEENTSQVSYDYNCDEEFTACNDDDCDLTQYEF